MSEWQSISTAPKDGKKILLGRFVPGQHRDGLQEVDFWHSTKKYGYEGWGKFNPQNWPPTHWMPLPAPPQDETQ